MCAPRFTSGSGSGRFCGRRTRRCVHSAPASGTLPNPLPQVDVFVNGQLVPFSMKIGEAGEAFFVFETDDDVPADLITSPIIQPTIPGKDSEQSKEEVVVDTDRFGAKVDAHKEQETAEHELTSNPEPTRIEPDFLDLDGNANEEAPPTPKQQYNVPQALRRSGSRATINQASLPSPPPSRGHSVERTRMPEMSEQDKRADEALKTLRSQAHVPEVEYHHGESCLFPVPTILKSL